MPGPIVHKTAMDHVVRILNQKYSTNYSAGDWFAVMEPDRSGSHGYDIPTHNGSILKKIKDTVSDMKSFGITEKRLRYLTHYILDAHTIGQIVAKYHGDTDNWIDFWSAFVSKKDKYLLEQSWNTHYVSIEILRQSMQHVYNRYYKNAGKWWWVFSDDLKEMIRFAVIKAVVFTVLFVDQIKTGKI